MAAAVVASRGDGCTAARRTISTTTSTGARAPLRTQALQNRRRRQLTRSHAISYDDPTCYSVAGTSYNFVNKNYGRSALSSPHGSPSSLSSASLSAYYRAAPDTPSPRRAETMVLLRTDTHRHIRVVRQENQAKSKLNASQVHLFARCRYCCCCRSYVLDIIVIIGCFYVLTRSDVVNTVLNYVYFWSFAPRHSCFFFLFRF